MLETLQPLAFLAAVVGFWTVLFATAIYMTRWALHGVGEPLAADADGLESADTRSSAPHGSPATVTSATDAGKATTGGGHA
jgi:hypothetical protein